MIKRVMCSFMIVKFMHLHAAILEHRIFFRIIALAVLMLALNVRFCMFGQQVEEQLNYRNMLDFLWKRNRK